MSILKKMIMREWFKFFLSALFILFLLVAVANLISGFLRGNVTALEVIINFLIETPALLNKIIPIACLVASLFSINKLKSRNELTAIFSSGYSRKNFILNIVQASTIIALFQFFNTSYIQPFVKSKRHLLIHNSESKFRNLKSKGLRASTVGSGKIWYKTDKYIFSFSAFNKNTNTLSGVDIYYFDETHHLRKKIKAHEIVYLKDNLWNFRDGLIYSNLNGSDFPSVKKIKNMPLVLNETPYDFEQIESDITTLNIIALYVYIRKLQSTGIDINPYLVMFLLKISSSLICIIFSLLASIAVFNPNRRTSSFGKNIFFVFIFTLLYWLVNSYLIELGANSKIDAFVACFAVPATFIIFLFLFFSKHRIIR